jgi:hypothetical protein
LISTSVESASHLLEKQNSDNDLNRGMMARRPGKLSVNFDQEIEQQRTANFEVGNKGLYAEGPKGGSGV